MRVSLRNVPDLVRTGSRITFPDGTTHPLVEASLREDAGLVDLVISDGLVLTMPADMELVLTNLETTT